eukprot:688055-Heterocapsa_arctica.AAC.1
MGIVAFPAEAPIAQVVVASWLPLSSPRRPAAEVHRGGYLQLCCRSAGEHYVLLPAAWDLSQI